MKKSKKTNANGKERRIIHVIILFTLVLLTFFIYSILIPITFIVGVPLCYMMEQIEGCCGHRIKSPVFSIGLH